MDEQREQESTNNVDSIAILVCDGTKFECSRKQLAEASPYFKCMFYGQLKESRSNDPIHIHDVTAAALEILISYSTSKEFAVTSENSVELLQASTLFQFDAVRDECVEFMKSDLNVGNCLDAMCIADSFEMEELHKAALHVALWYFDSVRLRPELLDLPKEQLISYLSDSRLKTKSELNVIDCLKSWILYDKVNRQKYLVDLLMVVRFRVLTWNDFDELIKYDFLKESNILELLQRIRELKYYITSSSNKFYSLAKKMLENPQRTIPIIPAMFGHGKAPERWTSVQLVYYDTRTRSFRRDAYFSEFFEEQHCAMMQKNQTFTSVQKSSLNFSVCAVKGQDVYIYGGKFDGVKSVGDILSLWSYNLLTKKSTYCTKLPSFRVYEILISVLDEFIYFVGYLKPCRIDLPAAFRYNIETDVWEELEAPPFDPSNTAAVVGHKGCLYVLTSKAFCYNPMSKKWSVDERRLLPHDDYGKIGISHNVGIYFINRQSHKLFVYYPQCNYYDSIIPYHYIGTFEDSSRIACIVDTKIYAFSFDSNMEVYDIMDNVFHVEKEKMEFPVQLKNSFAVPVYN